MNCFEMWCLRPFLFSGIDICSLFCVWQHPSRQERGPTFRWQTWTALPTTVWALGPWGVPYPALLLAGMHWKDTHTHTHSLSPSLWVLINQPRQRLMCWLSIRRGCRSLSYTSFQHMCVHLEPSPSATRSAYRPVAHTYCSRCKTALRGALCVWTDVSMFGCVCVCAQLKRNI